MVRKVYPIIVKTNACQGKQYAKRESETKPPKQWGGRGEGFSWDTGPGTTSS